MQNMGKLVRPALGNIAEVGRLYNARTGAFAPQISSVFHASAQALPSSLLQTESISPGDTASLANHTHTLSPVFVETDTYKDKFAKLGLDLDLQASLLGGLFNPQGLGTYLKDEHGIEVSVEGRNNDLTDEKKDGTAISAIYVKKTVKEILRLDNLEQLKQAVGPGIESVTEAMATHIVTEVSWGSTTVITANFVHQEGTDGADSGDKDKEAMKMMKDALQALAISAMPPAYSTTDENTHQKGEEEEISIPNMIPISEPRFSDITFRLYGDFIPKGGPLCTTFAGAESFMQSLEDKIQQKNNGKGQPISYALMPLSLLKLLCGIFSSDGNVQFQPTMRPNRKTISQSVQLLDEFRQLRRYLSGHLQLISTNQYCTPTAHIHQIEKLLVQVESQELGYRLEYVDALRGDRDFCLPGDNGQDEDLLGQVLNTFNLRTLATNEILDAIAAYTNKTYILRNLIKQGARYMGYKNVVPNSESDSSDPTAPAEIYSFKFNWTIHRLQDEFYENCTLLLQLLDLEKAATHVKGSIQIKLMDYDATNQTIEKPVITHERGSLLLSADLLQDRKELSSKAMMRCANSEVVHSDRELPIKMARVNLKCPGAQCNPAVSHNWICFTCRGIVSFCGVDMNFYCECGRSHHSSWIYHCPDPKHGEEWEPYPRKQLLDLLEGLVPFEALNILILGETGVGKSTFINAFVNYLTYDSLDEAMKAKDLNCIIPFSFATQLADDNGRFIQTMIHAGTDKHENTDSAKGQSATQKTVVHNVPIGKHTVRLFDTPGIGDTRGASQDTANMANILSVLANYDKIHGILILMKPNNARLTIMFRFCIKELLTHLHRDAARNMVFGFTNTRGSNYTPGDTFQPLEQTLSSSKEVTIPLCKDTVYCFDSESFRYLAAHHQGCKLGRHEDYSLSWEQSSRESHRLLEHFLSLEPHNVKSTISLNDTRHLVTQLTKPMAEIMRTINTTKKVNADSMLILRQETVKKADLEKQLYISIVTLKAHTLSKPRTVCADSNCVEYADDGTDPAKPNLRVVYKQLCHNPCYLTDIPTDTLAHPQLIHCSAFMGSTNCSECGHTWQQHLHILYELRPETITIRSTETETRLAAATTLIEKKQLLIEEKQRFADAIEAELQLIKQAAAQFSLYLKHNSITPYNDATIEYLTFMIKEERGKVSAGGDDAKLKELEDYRDQYQEQVRILISQMENGERSTALLTHKGVHDLVKELYSLKYYGYQLKQIKAVVARAHDNTFRERAHHVKVRSKVWGDFSDESQPAKENRHYSEPSTGRPYPGVREWMANVGAKGSRAIKQFWRGDEYNPHGGAHTHLPFRQRNDYGGNSYPSGSSSSQHVYEGHQQYGVNHHPPQNREYTPYRHLQYRY